MKRAFFGCGLAGLRDKSDDPLDHPETGDQTAYGDQNRSKGSEVPGHGGREIADERRRKCEHHFFCLAVIDFHRKSRWRSF